MVKYLEIPENVTAKPRRLAVLISKITNPCVLSIVMLTVVLFTGTNSSITLLRSIITLVFFLIILPLIYVFLRISRKPGKTCFEVDPTLFLKRHPLDIMILELVCGIPCLIVLHVLNAPLFALITLVNLLVIAFIVALFNFRYRVSFHLAAIAVLIYMTIVTWGLWWVWLIPVIPVIAWAKYKIHDHSPPQMVFGTIIGVTATSITLFIFLLLK